MKWSKCRRVATLKGQITKIALLAWLGSLHTNESHTDPQLSWNNNVKNYICPYSQEASHLHSDFYYLQRSYLSEYKRYCRHPFIIISIEDLSIFCKTSPISFPLSYLYFFPVAAFESPFSLSHPHLSVYSLFCISSSDGGHQTSISQ